MFYQGDLQSGINKAVQESKLVACFVTDDGEESNLWENDFLEDGSIKGPLSTETLLLRLKAGSQEAGFLAAIFPLPKNPTMVVIENGQLKEYLAAGVLKEEFLRRLGVVFQSRGATSLPQPHPGASNPSSGATSASVPDQEPQPQMSSSSSSSQTPVPAEEPSSRVVQDLLAERSARLEVHKKEQEAKEKAKRAAEAKARKAALEEATPPDSKKSADMKYALMQKKRQQDAREERARILKRVEDDKAERREREAQRKALAKELETTQNEGSTAASSGITPSSLSRSKECALQVRLFDGSTVRSRFSSQGTLRGDVRPWIDGQQAGDIPYTFKHVLTPLPNKNISISDEEQTLQSQGLTPSATLILVPVQDYTSAYSDSGAMSLVTRGVSAGWVAVSSGASLVTGTLGGILGWGGTGAQVPATESAPVSTALPSSVNVRTLRDQDRPEDHQFYNGNALNFEPRKDDEDKKDE